MSANTEQYGWWASLKHGGLLIAPGKLSQYFPEDIAPLPRRQAEQLRRDLTRFDPNDSQSLAYLLDTVLEEVLGLDRRLWFKNVGPEWSQKAITGETIRPRRVWVDAHEHAFPVFVEKDITRIGIGRGRRSVSRVVEWLRKADQKLALLTNGRQWRLIHAGADYNAWAESDTGQWLLEGQPGPQVDALRILLNPSTLGTDSADDTPLLWTAIQASRQGQAELSAELGERVRRAVELLIRESAVSINMVRGRAEFSNNDLYIAASRIIMRCVIILFAEARDLLPRDNVTYHNSYGLQGLREQLDRMAGGHAQERLRHSYSAWPRLLALFRLMYFGSLHESMPIPTYGGQLFTPGDAAARDPITRALLAFEQIDHCPSDAAVYRILELLTKSKIKVRQGNRNTWVDAPVDFSDLSTEYIGILYQGLLDFELRQAEVDEPMIFLNLGDQPVLPLSRLENMEDDALEALVENLKKSSDKPAASEDEKESEEDEEELEEEEGEEREGEEAEEESEPDEDEDEDVDTVRQLRERAVAWATRAVKAGKLVSKPRGSAPDVLAAYEADVAAFAPRLIARTILPGEWFLVRWGGTRKGSGTFYTRPQLGVPLVRRTLQPLAYQQVDDTWVPKLPEEILDLKVCDSAMGSASLLVAALRYLTGALYESLFYHDRIEAHGEAGICRLADGQLTNELIEESLPVPPDNPEFEDRLQARLKRYVVERCIYGVDLNPLAVELARLSLWIETMDPRLPFGFIDHKLKVGNTLVGCWFDRFQEYPVMAWEREGGDKNHTRFVHHFREFTATRGKKKGQIEQRGDKWTQGIKDMRSEVIKSQMMEWITHRDAIPFAFADEGYTAEELHTEAMEVFSKMHQLGVHDSQRKAELYQEEIIDNPAVQKLKQAFDTWCAIWFWPGDKMDLAPLPQGFQAPLPETSEIVEELAEQHHFFHWELEFPDVFAVPNAGFDAMLENPPWEIMKPKSQEYFSNIDPLYRTYGKQEALDKQVEYFTHNAAIEQDWLDYNARFRAMSNWNKYVAYPFGDVKEGGDRFSFSRSARETDFLHTSWREQRDRAVGFSDKQHPFRHQGSADINTYKMFLESSYTLLRQQGRMGMIVPSGLYTDKGSSDLRTLFLSHADWEWLFGFINWNKIFASVYYRFKFCMTIMQKGKSTQAINSVFSRYHIEEWEDAEKYIVPYPRQQVAQFSPNSKALLETRTQKDMDILAKIYQNSLTLGDDGEVGWGIEYSREFDMTNDSKLFPPLPKWEKQGYQADEYGHWLKGNWQPFNGNHAVLERTSGLILSRDGTQCIQVSDVEDIALPLYEGRMVGQFDFSQKGWVSGKGRTAVWQDIPFDNKSIEPQYLMGYDSFKKSDVQKGLKLAFLSIGSSTNARSMVCSMINNVPCGHSLSVLNTTTRPAQLPLLCAILNTFAYDFTLRCRLGGINVSYFVIAETPIVSSLSEEHAARIIKFATQLTLLHKGFSQEWNKQRNRYGNQFEQIQWKSLWAITSHERLRLQIILDAVVAELLGINFEGYGWMLKDSDQPVSRMRNKIFYRTLDPKGLWRVDKDKDPEMRHTVLSLIAFHDLQEKGLDAFLAQNNGEGWMLPETLRLADYGLGHDDRAKEHQPVASRLGPRFFPWQLQGTPEQSWAECERHAENLRLLLGDLIEEPAPKPQKPADAPPDYTPTTNLLGEPLQRDLFGNVLEPKKRKK